MIFSDFDRQCMESALDEARKGFGKTFPNPLVGAVIVRKGKVISRGFHERAGGDHAEIVALKKLGWPQKKFAGKGCALYVTLEPCAFFGRTPPCVNAILESGVERVIYAVRDPHDKDRIGEKLLRSEGIQVDSGLLEQEARMQNQFFFKNVSKKMPYVTAKVAMTLDGKIASVSGDSRGISAHETLQFVHELRKSHQAILVGIGTVLRDNPHLGVRYIEGPEPLRVVLDSELRSPLRSKIFRNKNIVVFAGSRAPKKKLEVFRKKNIRVVTLRKINPKEALRSLYREGICSVLVEGGSQVLTSFWEENLIDRYIVCIAPKLAGGEKALTPLSGKGIKLVKKFKKLENMSVKQLSGDIVLDGYFKMY